jgi:hypothetical protein
MTTRATIHRDNDNNDDGNDKKRKRDDIILAITVAVAAVYLVATIINLWFEGLLDIIQLSTF